MRENKDSSQPSLEIRLLGRFRAEIDGVPIDEKRWARRSAQSLVKLLALKPHHALHREQIMDLIWTEQPPETALNNLNKAIHAARRAFEPDLAKGSDSRYLLTSKNQIILDSPGSLSVDLDEFERLANHALRNDDVEAARQAVELYCGDLLTEDIYEDWIYARRETVRILFRKTATKTAEISAARGDYRTSIEILEKLFAEDATDERILRLLMRFYAETGGKYQALKQFDHSRANLLALGIEPEPETIRLEQSIKRGETLPAKNGNKTAPAEQAEPIVASTPPRITQLTFHNGVVKSANFLPDGETIVFSAAWSGAASELHAMRLETGETRDLGISDAEVYCVSAAGEIAAGLRPRYESYSRRATLAKLPLGDGAPREILKDVFFAAWHPAKSENSPLPDERFLAVVRDCGEKICLEFPVGNVVFETAGWLSSPKFSADGKKIAFIEHPILHDDRGCVVLLDLETGDKRELTETLVVVQGLAWANDEIWFTGERQGSARMIKAVNLRGEERPLYRGTGRLTLHDVSGRGAALVTDDKMRIQIAARRRDEDFERDLSWHDWTLARDLTDDGETLLFEEAGLSAGRQLSAYIRKTDGSGVKKIGAGAALALSPDGKRALLRFHDPRFQLGLSTLDTGEIKLLEYDRENPLVHQVFADFFPDGKRIIFAANDPDGDRQVYLQNLDGGKLVRFAPDRGVQMLSWHALSPDGERAVLTDAENRLALYRISGGTGSPLKNLEKGFWLIRWADDGENLFVWRREGLPAMVYKYNLASGKMEEWLKLSPKNATGVTQIVSIKLTPDGKTYAYSYMREASDLFLMEDLK